jgi:hypothetical protein
MQLGRESCVYPASCSIRRVMPIRIDGLRCHTCLRKGLSYLERRDHPCFIHHPSMTTVCNQVYLFMICFWTTKSHCIYRLFSTLLLSAGVVGCLFSPLISTRLLCQTAIVPSFHTHFIMNVPFRDARLNLDTCQSN